MSKFKPQAADWKQIAKYVASARKKVVTGRRVLGIDEETAFQLGYEAMLRASLGLVLSHGLRVRSIPGHHVAIIEFAEKHLGATAAKMIALFDRMRRKRNQALYDASGLITRTEAEQALETASKYIHFVVQNMASRHPQGKLPLNP